MGLKESSVVLLTWWTDLFKRGTYTTGCVIGNIADHSALILTCAHHLPDLFSGFDEDFIQRNLDDLKRDFSVTITFPDGVVKTGSLLRASLDEDLCVVALPSSARLHSVRFSEDELKEGDQIWTIHNRGIMKVDKQGNSVVNYLLRFARTSGSVSYAKRSHADLSTSVDFIQYGLPRLGFSSSGACIFNEKDEIVAVHSFEYQKVQYGVHVSSIKKFIQRAFNLDTKKSLNQTMKELEDMQQ